MAVSVQPKLALVYHEDAYVEAGGNALGLMGRQVAGRAFLEALPAPWHVFRADGLVAPAQGRQIRSSSSGATTARPRPSPGLCGSSTAETFIGRSFPRPPRPSCIRPSRRTPRSPGRGSKPGRTPSPCRESRTPSARPKPSPCSGRWSRLRSSLTTPSCAPRARWRTWSARSRGPMRNTSRHGLAECQSMTGRLDPAPAGDDPPGRGYRSVPSREPGRASHGAHDPQCGRRRGGRSSMSDGCRITPRHIRSRCSAARARPRRRRGRRVHLILAGWAAHPAVHDAFVEARATSPPACGPRSSTAAIPACAAQVWHAADVFVSPSDNIQETFGLAVVEAMASGLPVVASDWDGYRDLVDDGRDRFPGPDRHGRRGHGRRHRTALDRRIDL